MLQPAGTVHGVNNDTTQRDDEIAAPQGWSKGLGGCQKQRGSDT
jgi:hypothetical protein